MSVGPLVARASQPIDGVKCGGLLGLGRRMRDNEEAKNSLPGARDWIPARSREHQAGVRALSGAYAALSLSLSLPRGHSNGY